MRPLKSIAVLGDGGWGTTLAIQLLNKGHEVLLWSVFENYARLMRQKRMNPYFLKGIRLPKRLEISSDLNEALSRDLLVIAVPSIYLRNVLLKSKSFYKNSTPVVSVVKGIESKTLLRMSEVINSVWHPKKLAVISGPTIAMEIAKGVPSAAVASSKNMVFMSEVQDLFMSDRFRVYRNSDIIGVELAGSLKNIIAIACGISDGLGFGTNTKAAILSRGLVEMARLGIAMGGKKETFSGISGLGDLVTTCFNPLSRNHLVGQKIGEGKSIKRIISSMKMVAEGVYTVKSAYKLGRKFKVEMPIVNEIFHVLFNERSPRKAVENLMLREKRHE